MEVRHSIFSVTQFSIIHDENCSTLLASGVDEFTRRYQSLIIDLLFRVRDWFYISGKLSSPFSQTWLATWKIWTFKWWCSSHVKPTAKSQKQFFLLRKYLKDFARKNVNFMSLGGRANETRWGRREKMIAQMFDVKQHHKYNNRSVKHRQRLQMTLLSASASHHVTHRIKHRAGI